MNDDLFEWASRARKAQSAVNSIIDEHYATEQAIQTVTDHNSPSPLDQAFADAVKRLPSLPSLVSVDTIIPDISPYNFTDGRALGALMRRLAKENHIRKTDQFRKSVRPGNHLTPRALYENLHH